MQCIRYLQVDNLAKLAEMIVEHGNVVKAAWNLLHFQAAIGRVETASTQTVVIEIAFLHYIAVLRNARAYF